MTYSINGVRIALSTAIDVTPNDRTTLRADVLLADPPWNECGAGKHKRGADRYYPLMKTAEIVALEPTVREITADDCFLFLWVTNNFLPDGLEVMRAWGFDYKTNFCWVKDSIGLGFYARGQHELCLLGVRGKPPRAKRTADNWGTDVSSVHFAPKRGHSAKPESFYEIVEGFGNRRVELFARRERKGWTSLGNELGVEL